MRFIYAALMLLFAIIPGVVIYDLLSRAIVSLPPLNAPEWFVSASFVCIFAIIYLSFLLLRYSDKK